MGSRRSVLDHLLGEAPQAALEALAEAAEARVPRHAAWRPVLGGIAVHWAGRARDTASLLQDLAAAAGAGRPTEAMA
jgi:hypothetical protein